MAESDCQLVSSARAGDRQAVVELLRRHGPDVRRRIRGRIPRRWRSVLSEDDVMQQTYADAVLGIGRFEPRGDHSFAAWMGRLAQWNLRGALRTLQARKRGGDRRRVEPGGGDGSARPLVELLATTSSTPSRCVAREEALSALSAALARLPPTYRLVIELYDLEQRSIGQVSADLGRSEGAVYMLRARAHQRLADVMGHASDFFTNVA